MHFITKNRLNIQTILILSSSIKTRDFNWRIENKNIQNNPDAVVERAMTSSTHLVVEPHASLYQRIQYRPVPT